MNDDRYCSNCRAELPKGAETCPTCGTFAGDVFDGRMPGKQFRIVRLLIILVFIAAAAYGGWWLWQRQQETRPTPDNRPVRVVRQRPGGAKVPAGATISEPEAVMFLRRHFSSEVKGECLAMTSQGYRDQAYHFTVVDSCRGVRLGKWQVDANSRKVMRE